MLGAMLLAAACGREPAHDYPAEVVDNFVAACRTRAPEPTCRCAIDRLQDRFAWDEFRIHEARMAKGEMPDEVAHVVGACAQP